MSERSESLVAAGLAHLDDGRLVCLAQGGNCMAMDHLLGRYRPVVEVRAHDYFWVGTDIEDAVQEGMIGLYKAIRDYSEAANTSFRAFAELCIHRQIITALKATTRRKHSLLNLCLTMTPPVGNDERYGVLTEALADNHPDSPERTVIGRDMWANIRRFALRGLSQLEWQVLLNYLGEERYQDIAAQLGCNAKQIDNALQRAKKKIISRFAAQITN